MKRYHSLIFKILSALLIIAVLSSFALISIECFHDCSGEDCPICRAVCNLKKLTWHADTFTEAAAVLISVMLCITVFCAVPRSIVSPLFKVKLLD